MMCDDEGYISRQFSVKITRLEKFNEIQHTLERTLYDINKIFVLNKTDHALEIDNSERLEHLLGLLNTVTSELTAITYLEYNAVDKIAKREGII